jgi:hypothetical protein
MGLSWNYIKYVIHELLLYAVPISKLKIWEHYVAALGWKMLRSLQHTPLDQYISSVSAFGAAYAFF